MCTTKISIVNSITKNHPNEPIKSVMSIKKNISWFFRLILILLVLVLFFQVRKIAAQADTLFVTTSIQNTIQNAEPGMVIYIPAGVYTEETIIVKTEGLTITGEKDAILDGDNKRAILIIEADDVTINGLTFRNTGISYTRDHAAIEVRQSVGYLISNNSLINNFFGIYLSEADKGVVEGNRITASGTREANTGNGIHMWNTNDVVIRNNTIRGHRDGIYLEFAKNAIIEHNISENNLRYGLHYMFSDLSVYQHNTFRKNGAGVAVMYSRRVQMNDNLFEQNWGSAAYGLLLKDIDDSEIKNNIFRENTIALYSEGSNKLDISNNLFELNGWAVKLFANSTQNEFRYNSFIENTFDVATNSRQHYNTFESNYWSKYAGYDLVGDGIGDVPHRPVRLYSLIVEQNPVSLILHRSLFIDVLDIAERVLPALTPETLVDSRPLMKRPTP